MQSLEQNSSACKINHTCFIPVQPSPAVRAYITFNLFSINSKSQDIVTHSTQLPKLSTQQSIKLDNNSHFHELQNDTCFKPRPQNLFSTDLWRHPKGPKHQSAKKTSPSHDLLFSSLSHQRSDRALEIGQAADGVRLGRWPGPGCSCTGGRAHVLSLQTPPQRREKAIATAI